MGWQPIDTAPKDGTEILAWVNSTAGDLLVMIAWHRGEWVDIDDQVGWMTGYGPTHWMPLPTPPDPVIAQSPAAAAAR